MKIKIKILASLLIAFTLTSVFSNTVFIAGTPYINKPFLAELINSPGVFFNRTKDYIASMRGGQKGVEEYQQKRVQEYQANSKTPLPSPVRKEEYVAQGYKETGKGVYQKSDKESKTIYVNISADTKFEKRQMNLDGKIVDVWTPL
ncbi:MAG: hypothetical protein U0525_05295 [Patescibacteria group bacterium]